MCKVLNGELWRGIECLENPIPDDAEITFIEVDPVRNDVIVHLRSASWSEDSAVDLPTPLIASRPWPKSVLQDWVMRLPLREQGGLLVALRGCDLTPKYPLTSPERELVSAIRGAVLVPADPREVNSVPGCFMTGPFPPSKQFKLSAFGHYPTHWVSHTVHAAEILGYRYPDVGVRDFWLSLYREFCHSLHLNPETFDQFVTRLSEDRIANGSIVS